MSRRVILACGTVYPLKCARGVIRELALQVLRECWFNAAQWGEALHFIHRSSTHTLLTICVILGTAERRCAWRSQQGEILKQTGASVQPHRSGGHEFLFKSAEIHVCSDGLLIYPALFRSSCRTTPCRRTPVGFPIRLGPSTLAHATLRL
jgi:hypothetical protein